MIEIVLLGLMLQADDATRAAKMLEESAAVLRKTKQIVIEVEGTMETEGAGSAKRTWWKRISLDESKRSRVEAKMDGVEWLTVQDGSHYWALDVAKNEYTRYPMQRRPFSDLIPAQLFFGENPMNLLGSEIAVVKIKDDDAITWLVKGRGNPVKHWLWFDKDRFPRSFSNEGGSMDGRTWERIERYKFDLAPTFDDKTFVFTPPAGSKQLETPKLEVTAAPKIEIPKAAVEIITRAAAALRVGAGLSYEVEAASTGPIERTWKTKVVAQKPDRYRVEGAGIVVVSDGTTCWYYDGASKKYMKYEPQHMPFAVAEKALGFFLGASPEQSLNMANDVDVAREKGRDKIIWTQHDSIRNEWTFDATTGLPVQFAIEGSREGDAYRMEWTYTAFDVAATPAADAFEFKPPEGASERTAVDSDWEARLLSVGSAAPELKGPDPAGRELKLSDFKGKPVLVAFSNPSTQELQWLQKQHDAWSKRGLVVLGVQPEEGRKWLAERFLGGKFTVPVLLLKEGLLDGLYGIRVLPTLYVIGADGNVTARMARHDSYGYSEAKLRAALDKAIK